MDTSEQWPRVKEIVAEAVEREFHARGVYLDEVCGQDVALRLEVDSLVAAFDESGRLFGVESPQASLPQQDIGPYRLIRELGLGGMGQVWLAEQTEPVRRLIALKVIRAGIFDAEVVKRFQAERQSLAIMDHPAIAKVFDAGTTSAGQPYFAMEYVDGLPITEYCDQNKLGIRERLTLFLQVCEGVQHAHQKAIIHRDLKPSNILVVDIDGKPRPRIIDFGLAKAMAPSAPGQTLFTRLGAFLGTPGYMSPEQADPDVQDIDTRADVYSLGVLLYELLTGFLPFDSADWKKKKLDEILRQLRESDPRRPSSKVSANRDTSSTQAAARGVDSRQLAKLLRGDLDWIALKALEKERERRYGSAFELAADIGRYLENRPVVARPVSTAYRFRKYIRRNRASLAVATGIFILLIAFAVTQTVQLRRITRERDRADRITDFMTNMFEVSDPSEARGNTVTAREILDKSAKDIDTGLAKDPELKAQMLSVIATVYQGLGLDSRAEPLLEEAISLRRRSLGPVHPDTLRSRGQLGSVFTAQGRYPEAETLDRDLLEDDRRVLGPEHRDTLTTQRNFFWLLNAEGHPADAERLGRETFEMQRRIFGQDDPDTLLTMRQLGSVMERADHLPAAEELTRQIIEIRKRVSGPDDPQTLLAMSDLGRILNQENRGPEAEVVYRPTLAMQQHVLGPDHPNLVSTMDGLAMALRRQHKLDEAEKLCRGALDISSRVLGPEHPTTLLQMGNLALIFQERKQYQDAERLQRQVVEIRRRTLGIEHFNTTVGMGHLAEVLHLEGRDAESAVLLREAAEIQRRTLGPSHRYTLYTSYNLACVLAADHKPIEALSVLREVVEKGFASVDDLKSDPDFKPLRKDPRFKAMIEQAKQRDAVAPKIN